MFREAFSHTSLEFCCLLCTSNILLLSGLAHESHFMYICNYIIMLLQQMCLHVCTCWGSVHINKVWLVCYISCEWRCKHLLQEYKVGTVDIPHSTQWFTVSRIFWGVFNHWTGIWNGTMEWTMEWTMETIVTGFPVPSVHSTQYGSNRFA